MTPTFLLRMDPIPPSSKKVHPYTFDKEQLTPVRPNFVRFVKSCQALSEILDFSLKSKYIQSGTLIHFTLSSQASSEISFEKATRTPFSWAKESKTLLKTSHVSWPAFPEREQHSPNTVLNDPPFFSHTLVVSFITFTAVSCISFFWRWEKGLHWLWVHSGSSSSSRILARRLVGIGFRKMACFLVLARGLVGIGFQEMARFLVLAGSVYSVELAENMQTYYR